ncbi:nicotinate-nucleotide adenylyltransferase [Jannaschia rubra]|uniref:Probable nicotinate-nucleotide adenylyltransferase n=1 Tax=Jannaschia rubra TaxID=282197 RepID=A0A0M6XTG1_9RHOB|nr:nicotinate-nucleotide adenylyltransferase [Jannaschia rubra]CTQ33254.1 Nicotinate-nucleotide adenylyltransferase [Jannaschia rubra]SFF97887.1 nicotinate-nucleotide adenylyltransferase [Jannaschia rubra]
MQTGFPIARPGQVIGLLGGSFDPAHGGHVHITLQALARLGLDRLWWVVSPGNPLKLRGPAALDRRMAEARRLMRHPRVTVTDVEARLGTRHTADTLAALRARYPGVRFVWIMGADNLATFHHWDRWRDIMEGVPVAVLARPGQGLAALRSPAATIYRRFRVAPGAAQGLGLRAPPAWTFLTVPMHGASSSAIRAGGGWPAAPAPTPPPRGPAPPAP